MTRIDIDAPGIGKRDCVQIFLSSEVWKRLPRRSSAFVHRGPKYGAIVCEVAAVGGGSKVIIRDDSIDGYQKVPMNAGAVVALLTQHRYAVLTVREIVQP